MPSVDGSAPCKKIHMLRYLRSDSLSHEITHTKSRPSALPQIGDPCILVCPVQTSAQEAMRKVRLRREEQERKEELLRDKQSVLEQGGHPYGIQPMGNMYGGTTPSIRGGLGALAPLTDQTVLDLLEMLDARQLGLLTICSRVLYVFCHHDDLWRTLVLRVYGGSFIFKDTWKNTFGSCFMQAAYRPCIPRKFGGVYSDVLFQPWLCASLGICPEWLERSNIPRRSNLSVEDFIAEFECPNRPVIITDVVTQWPAMRKWTREYLEAAHGDMQFACGPVDMRLRDFFEYAGGALEERPLYLFDKLFADKCPALADDYSIPPYFRTDLFSVLGATRPDWRLASVPIPNLRPPNPNPLSPIPKP
jgi:hypothetical protein